MPEKTASEPPCENAFQRSVEDTLKHLKSDPHSGLREEEARARRKRYGLNQLAVKRRHPWWAIPGAFLTSLYLFEQEDTQATSIAFLTLAFAQLWQVFNMYSTKNSFLRNEVSGTLWVWGGDK